MANNNADIELLAGLSIDSSEAEILKAIKIIEKRLKANHDARFKLNVDIDETVIKNTVAKLQNILKGKELNIETKSSIVAITKEVDAMADVVTVARKAAKEKIDFAKANERVRNSADNTADAVNRERDAMESLDDVESILNGINIHGQYGTSVFQRFGDTLRDAFMAYSAANLLQESVHKVVEVGKEAVETVKELNDVSTSLRMATGGSKDDVGALIDSYNNLGQELGSITSDVADSADAWLRQGHNIQDTNELIVDSMILGKIANLDSAESTEYLTSIMQAYRLEANQVIDTVSRLSAVDLESASSAGGLAKSMSRCASAAEMAGVGMDKLIGYIATVKEVTQDSDEAVGNMFKSVFSRMNQIRAGKFVDLETGEALNDTEKVLNKIGIATRDLNNQLINSEQILDSIGKSWKTYDSNTQKALATAVAGTYQYNKFIALMQNYSDAINYANISANSEGIAEEKFEYYLESLEAKTNSLIASLENLASTTISEELYASVLDISKEIVDLTADAGILKSALVGLGTGATAYTFTHLARFMNESAQGLSNFSAALNLVNNGVTANDMQALVDLSHGLSNSQMRLLLSTNNLTDAQKITLMVANGTERELAEQQLQTWGLINAQNNATASTVTLGSAMRGLAASMIANPIFAITTAVTLGITAFNLYQSAVEKAEQKLKDLQTTLNETTTELEGVQSEIDNINKQIDDLLAKDTLSITDENDLKRLREENEELRARKILLDAQREEDAKAVNKEVEHRYEKDFLAGANYHFNSDSGVGEYHNNIDYLDIQIDRANELLALNRNLTEEEKEEFGAIKSYITEQSNALVELADSYEPITEEQKALKEGWEELIAKSSEVVGTYAGTIPDITDRLVEKFATGKGTQKVNNEIKEWLDSLSDENKKIMIGCELDNATLEQLKAYLKEQTADIETSGVADVEVKLSFDYGTLEEISQKLANVESAYKLASEARDAYNEQGYYSMDVIDSILALEDEYINTLIDENGQLQYNSETFKELAKIKLEEAKASIYQEACEELVRIKQLDTALSAQELALINGTLTESAYEVVKALYEEVVAMGGANAALAQNTWETAQKKVALLDNQLKDVTTSTYDFAKSSGSASKEFSETIDFFEERVENLNDAISLLDANLENVVGSFAKNNLLNAQSSIYQEEIRNYTDALSMYQQKANEVLSTLPDDIAEKVKNGAVDLTTFMGESSVAVVDAIKDYQKWSDSVSSCKQELAELQQELETLELSKFTNIIEDFTSQFDIREGAKDLIDKTKEWIESSGSLVGDAFFTQQIEQSQKQLTLLQEEKAKLVEQMNSSLASGRVSVGSKAFLSMLDSLQEVESSIIDVKTEIEELDNSLKDLHWENLDRVSDRFSGISDEIDNLIGLIDDVDVSDSNGNWSSGGLAQLGLYSQGLELALYSSQMYAKEIENLNQAYLNGEYTLLEYQEKLADLSEKQWDAVNSVESMKDAIVDLNKQRVDIQIEGIEKEISAYESLIQSKIDALDAEKSLADYRDSISDKTKSITDIERQLAAMEGDNTASTIAKRKKLEQELADAKTDLERTQYDHSVEMQKEALDKELERFEKEKDDEIKKLEESLEDQETLIYNSMESVKENSAIIGQEIENIAKKHGVSISKSITNSWKNGEKAIASYGSVLSAQSSAFIGELVRVEVETYNLQAQANVTASSLANMFGTRADNLVSQLTESYYSEANLYNMTNALQNSLRSTLEGGYNVSSITSALNSITDAANKAKTAMDDINNTDTSSKKWYVVDRNGKKVSSQGYDYYGEAYSKIGLVTGGVDVKQFAKGTRNSPSGLIVTDEEGYELKLPKLANGNYTIANEGTQILTKTQTDNIFEWSKMNPNMVWDVPLASNLPKLPDVVRKQNPTVNVHYDSFMTVNGDINDTNHFTKQIENIFDRKLDKEWKGFYDELRY